MIKYLLVRRSEVNKNNDFQIKIQDCHRMPIVKTYFLLYRNEKNCFNKFDLIWNNDNELL